MARSSYVNSEFATKVVEKNFQKFQNVNQDWLYSHLYSIKLIPSSDKTQIANLLDAICRGIKRDSNKFIDLIKLFRRESTYSYISRSLESDYDG